VANSLVILGCSKRKEQTSLPLAAIDRYDGPVFRVLRRYYRTEPATPPVACVLSARFGLIAGDFQIPRYDRALTLTEVPRLRSWVEGQVKRTLDEIQPNRVFVSVGQRYWSLLEEPLTRQVDPAQIRIATGGIGGRASQLRRWLRVDEEPDKTYVSNQPTPEAALLGTIVRLTPDEVYIAANMALSTAGVAPYRFETWYVQLGQKRVAAKWLVGVLAHKHVSRFRTADARRVLKQLGVPVFYADR
jgi:hypothetical protein